MTNEEMEKRAYYAQYRTNVAAYLNAAELVICRDLEIEEEVQRAQEWFETLQYAWQCTPMEAQEHLPSPAVVMVLWQMVNGAIERPDESRNQDEETTTWKDQPSTSSADQTPASTSTSADGPPAAPGSTTDDEEEPKSSLPKSEQANASDSTSSKTPSASPSSSTKKTGKKGKKSRNQSSKQ